MGKPGVISNIKVSPGDAKSTQGPGAFPVSTGAKLL